MIYDLNEALEEEILCPFCGKRTPRNYYTDKDNTRTAALLYDPGRKGYLLRGDQGETFVGGVNEPLPQTLAANGVHMKHCCKACSGRLPGGYGYWPAFIIALAGPVGSGKSAFLKAVGQIDNLSAFHGEEYPYELSLSASAEQSQAEATNISSPGETRCLYIRRKRDRQIVACVMLVDSSGEAQDAAAMKDTDGRYQSLLNASSAAIYVLDMTKPGDTDTGGFNSFRNAVDSRANYPVAVVLSHFDGFDPHNSPHLGTPEFRSGGSRALLEKRKTFRVAPRLSPDTFLQSGRDPESVRSRFTMQQYISRFFKGQAGALLNREERAGFVVQSCTYDPRTQSEHFAKQINVLDPLIYLLNQLGLFPIPQPR